MKIITLLTLTLGLGASITLAQAQPSGPSGGPPDGGKFPMPPVIKALDANHDGEISSNEITNASAELKTLDKNADGKLSAEELKPKFDGDFTPPEGFKIPTLPVLKALDTNGDGELDANEIAQASAALKTLDKNGDGKLTRGETLPKPPEGFGGADGPPPGQ